MRRRRSKKWLWWGVGILLVIAIIVVIIVKNNEGSKGSEVGGTTQGEQAKTEENKKPTEEKTEPEVKKEEIPQYSGDDPNKSETLTGVVSYAGVVGDKLIVRLNIDQYLTDGSCKLNLIKDNTTIYNIVVGVETSVATSTCKGFEVPVAELSKGDLKIEIDLNSGDKYGKILGEVTI